MLGALIGDTVGSIYEFNNIHTDEFPLFSKASTYTDDSIMSMAVADWLINDDEHTHSALIEAMEAYYKMYPNPMGGYGERFLKWLKTPTAEKKPYNSLGNGSAMRVAACGWVARSKEEAKLLAKISAEVTHDHPEGIKGAQAIATAIYMLRHAAFRSDIEDLMRNEFGYHLEKFDDLRKNFSFDETCPVTIPAAVAAFMGGTADVEETAQLAVSLGGDSDTIACIATALAEAFCQYCEADTMREMRKRLPEEWWPIIQLVQTRECRRVASDNITELNWEQVFVFGSNKDGQHYGGAANYAHHRFGAEWGVGEGRTGSCYALPTMEGFESMAEAVQRFTRWAEEDRQHIYLVTPVGCGIAGYTPDEVAPLFLEAAALGNVYLPQSFWDVIKRMKVSNVWQVVHPVSS